jgi:hypothetical protein
VLIIRYEGNECSGFTTSSEGGREKTVHEDDNGLFPSDGIGESLLLPPRGHGAILKG